MKKLIVFFLNSFFKYFKIQNKIIFESGRGLIDGNTKAVYDYLIENHPNKFKIIWLVDRRTDTSMLRKKDYVYYRTLSSYYHLATAKYWIRSQSLGSLLKKKKQQIYIQLWHGNGAMKHMEYDILAEKERPPVEHVKEWDYYIANDELDAQHIKSATGYNKKIEILGMACLDNTLKQAKDKNLKKKLLKKLDLLEKSKGKKIILYAPTFRDFDLQTKTIDVPIEKLSKLKQYII